MSNKGTLDNPYTTDEMEVIIREVCDDEKISDMADDLIRIICVPGMGIEAKVKENDNTGLWDVYVRYEKVLSFINRAAAERFIDILFGKLFPNQELRENNI